MSVLLAVLLFFSALISASETALFSLTKGRLASLKKKSCRYSKMCTALLESPKNLLITLLMVNVSVNIGVQNVFSSQYSSNHWFYSIAIPLILTLVFGEIIPKSIALCMNDRIARWVSPFLYFLRCILTPFRFIFLSLAKLIMRCIFLKSSPIVPEEKIFAIEKSLSLGLIGETEGFILNGAADLSQIKLKEIMRPKGEFIFWDIRDSFSHLIDKFSVQECGKIVVFRKEQVLGILYQENFFKVQDSIESPDDILKVIEKPSFLVDTFNCKRALELMLAEEHEICLVVDEYAALVGLVTSEDLVERIVGKIHDKRDEKKLYTVQKDGSIICSGKLLVRDLEDLLNWKIEGTFDCSTIGGVLTQIDGGIPNIGRKMALQGFCFHVLGVNKKRVKSLHICKGV